MPSSKETNVLQQIQATQAEIVKANAEAQVAMVEVSSLTAQKPRPPNTSGLSEEEKARANTQYQTELSMWRRSTKAAQARIGELQRRMTELQSQLLRLNNVELPKARNGDTRALEEQLRALEGIVYGRTGGLSSTDEAQLSQLRKQLATLLQRDLTKAQQAGDAAQVAELQAKLISVSSAEEAQSALRDLKKAESQVATLLK